MQANNVLPVDPATLSWEDAGEIAAIHQYSRKTIPAGRWVEDGPGGDSGFGGGLF